LEFLILLIIGIYLYVQTGIWIENIFAKQKEKRQSNRRSNQNRDTTYSSRGGSQSSSQPRGTFDSSAPKTQKKASSIYTYRPSSLSNSYRQPIQFSDTGLKNQNLQIGESLNIDSLHDAFTGAPLDRSLGLFQCSKCKVYYHKASYEILKEENNSQCISCNSTNIIEISYSGSRTGFDFKPSEANITNYKKFEGTVATFSGGVVKVLESRRGNDFAVMFENKSWVNGFKLVFFRGTIGSIGGKRYLNSLIGNKIKVRGLVVNHERYGYEIIISEKSMILEDGK